MSKCNYGPWIKRSYLVFYDVVLIRYWFIFFLLLMCYMIWHSFPFYDKIILVVMNSIYKLFFFYLYMNHRIHIGLTMILHWLISCNIHGGIMDEYVNPCNYHENMYCTNIFCDLCSVYYIDPSISLKRHTF